MGELEALESSVGRAWSSEISLSSRRGFLSSVCFDDVVPATTKRRLGRNLPQKQCHLQRLGNDWINELNYFFFFLHDEEKIKTTTSNSQASLVFTCIFTSNLMLLTVTSATAKPADTQLISKNNIQPSLKCWIFVSLSWKLFRIFLGQRP